MTDELKPCEYWKWEEPKESNFIGSMVDSADIMIKAYQLKPMYDALITAEQSRRAVHKKGNMIYQFETKKKIENCFQCPCRNYDIEGNFYCSLIAENTDCENIPRPKWCPLVEVKGEKE